MEETAAIRTDRAIFNNYLFYMLFDCLARRLLISLCQARLTLQANLNHIYEDES